MPVAPTFGEWKARAEAAEQGAKLFALRSETFQRQLEAAEANLARAREILKIADDALCEYACFTPEAPCLRPSWECLNACGKEAGEALIAIRASRFLTEGG